MYYMHNVVLFSHKEKQNHDICEKMGEYHIKQSEPYPQIQKPHVFPYIYNLGVCMCMT